MARTYSATTSAAAIGIFMAGGAAHADVTADQVWNDWKGYMEGFGYAVEAEESMEGDVLSVDNLVLRMILPEEDAGAMSIAVGDIDLTENGDGTVALNFPPEMDMRLSVSPKEGETVEALIEQDSKGYSVVVSGDPGDMTFTYAAEELTLALSDLVVNGTSVDMARGRLSLAGVAGTTTMATGELREVAQNLTTGPVSYSFDFKDPETEGRMQIEGRTDALTFEGKGKMPPEMDGSNLAASLEAGFEFDGSVTLGSGESQFNFIEDGQTVEGSSSTGGATVNVAMDESRLSYGGEAENYELRMSGGELPFPLELAMQKAAFDLLLPVAEGEEDQDFGFGLTLADFTMSDQIWALFDPEGQLPRDPATVALDLTGKARMLVDLLDPKEMAGLEDSEQAPGELKALDLNTLRVSAAGAELTGEGKFTFDNSDTETFNGLPAPDGAVDLTLTGANALLDKLVGMDLLPEEQAMGARMMLGMFAVPGEGEDTLNSKIEVTPDGQVKANGQRIR